VQHSESYSGPDVTTKSARLIVLQSIIEKNWTKLDLIIPYDWANDTFPPSAQFQVGYKANNKPLYMRIYPPDLAKAARSTEGSVLASAANTSSSTLLAA